MHQGTVSLYRTPILPYALRFSSISTPFPSLPIPTTRSWPKSCETPSPVTISRYTVDYRSIINLFPSFRSSPTTGSPRRRRQWPSLPRWSLIFEWGEGPRGCSSTGSSFSLVTLSYSMRLLWSCPIRNLLTMKCLLFGCILSSNRTRLTEDCIVGWGATSRSIEFRGGKRGTTIGPTEFRPLQEGFRSQKEWE